MNTTAPAPTRRVEYRPTYFMDEPGLNGHKRTDFSNLLFVEIITTSAKGRTTRKTDVIEFLGTTRDKADQKMRDWIEREHATEKPEAED